MSWTPLETDDGSWTLRRARDGASCHSTAGAWTQACERYAAPCRVAELGSERGVVRVLEVGTGLGLNLAAALRALAASGARLEACSLELDSSVIEASLDLPQGPECARWLAPVQGALRVALERRDSRSCELEPGLGLLELRLGDAARSLEELDAGRFDAVFFDPFAPADEPRLWTRAVLASVARAMAPHAILSTYSAALDARAGLAAAGLRVGQGPRVGRKAQGTLASFTAPLPPLHPRLARRIAARASRFREA